MRQENRKFKANLGNLARLCLKIKKIKVSKEVKCPLLSHTILTLSTLVLHLECFSSLVNTHIYKRMQTKCHLPQALLL